MIVADSSAWIELLRATRSPADRTLTRLLGRSSDIVLTEVVVMEVLAGAVSEQQFEELRDRFLAYPILPLHGLEDYVDAAKLYRACQAAGERLGKMTDCLVAVPAIRAEARVLTADRDFDVIARHTPLEVYPLDD